MLYFMLGTIFGSFAHVVAYRTLHQLPFVAARSTCDNCARPLAPFELVPLVSFIALRGKCRTCHTTISPAHFFSELFCGASFFALAYFLAPASATFYFFWLVLAGILALQDSWSQTIAVVPLIFGHLILYSGALVTGQPFYFATTLLAASIALFLYFFLKKKIGLGDVALLLLWSPLLSLDQFLWLIIFACLLAIPIALFNKEKKLPFVPFLALGAVLSLLFMA